jgi:propanol-preferring alcohol dehydrogenase
MRAMILERTATLADRPEPLRQVDLPVPEPGAGEVLLEVLACGVCHTELDEIEGRTPPPSLPVIPGHEVVGRVTKRGPGADRHALDDRSDLRHLFDGARATYVVDLTESSARPCG